MRWWHNIKQSDATKLPRICAAAYLESLKLEVHGIQDTFHVSDFSCDIGLMTFHAIASLKAL